MKGLFLSFVVGLGVGVIYALVRVKSPAPPIIALLGLLLAVSGTIYAQAALRAGLARVDITPPRGTAMAGYPERTRS